MSIIINADGFSTSKNELLKFEEKYGVKSMEFFTDYYAGFADFYDYCYIEDDIDNWIFYCNTFLSCGGNLNNVGGD